MSSVSAFPEIIRFFEVVPGANYRVTRQAAFFQRFENLVCVHPIRLLRESYEIKNGRPTVTHNVGIFNIQPYSFVFLDVVSVVCLRH